MSVNSCADPGLAQRCQLRMRRDTSAPGYGVRVSKARRVFLLRRVESACDMDADSGGPLFGRYQAVDLDRGLPRVSRPRDLSDDGATTRAVQRLIERLPHLGTFLSRVG